MIKISRKITEIATYLTVRAFARRANFPSREKPAQATLGAMSNSSEPQFDLRELGFGEFFAEALDPKIGAPGRVVRDGRDLWHVVCAHGKFVAALAGKFRRNAKARIEQPTVGDWVLVETKGRNDRALIHRLLPRRTVIARKVPGENMETQAVAANVDKIFIVHALDGGRNFNLRRIERYLALARESGAPAALVLNKSDLCDNPQRYADELRALAPETPVHVTCAISGSGVDGLRAALTPQQTFVLIGPSGVGKSALVNQLFGEEAKETGEVRARDKRGRHTTSYRELLKLPNGALIIDTPGLREIQLWGREENLLETFPDVEQLATGCRFADCRHEQEPGCAVRAAVAAGKLAARRLDNYMQLRAELEGLVERQQRHRQRVERRNRRLLQHGVDKQDAPRKGTWE